MWSELDDEEIEYGRWYEYDAQSVADEDGRVRPPEVDIWPEWDAGVPYILRRSYSAPPFYRGNVRYHYRPCFRILKLNWSLSYELGFLRKNYGLLPSPSHSRQWSGVYRLFAPGIALNRVLGTDPTGTLYIGRAGGQRNWSILRTRLMALVKGEHHVALKWSDGHEKLGQWRSLRVQWAYTGTSSNHRGEEIPESNIAEAWLLNCYRASYGEFPPLNEKV